jgi:hypothetical protein
MHNARRPRSAGNLEITVPWHCPDASTSRPIGEEIQVRQGTGYGTELVRLIEPPH